MHAYLIQLIGLSMDIDSKQFDSIVDNNFSFTDSLNKY